MREFTQDQIDEALISVRDEIQSRKIKIAMEYPSRCIGGHMRDKLTNGKNHIGLHEIIKQVDNGQGMANLFFQFDHAKYTHKREQIRAINRYLKGSENPWNN